MNLIPKEIMDAVAGIEGLTDKFERHLTALREEVSEVEGQLSETNDLLRQIIVAMGHSPTEAPWTVFINS